jgi:iron complex outermembrane receptor protein
MNLSYVSCRGLRHTLFLFFITTITLSAQTVDTTIVFDPVVITAPGILLAKNSLNGYWINNYHGSVLLIPDAPTQSVHEVLDYVPAVDLKRRGPEAMQGDISVLGGSFEQTLLLLDGLRMNDPQTGHHTMNLPVNLGDIEQIEIIKGAASGAYGPNAFSGVINLITKRPSRPTFSADVQGGSFGYYAMKGQAAQPFALADARDSVLTTLSLSHSHSDGYRQNTAFAITTGYASATMNFLTSSMKLAGGFTNRTFGANNFYADNYPNQWERTNTFFLSSTADFRISPVAVTAALFWRRNNDHYELNHLNPSFYQNGHRTDVTGAEVRTAYNTGIFRFGLSGSLTLDQISSTNLGEHFRREGGASGYAGCDLSTALHLLASGFAYKYDSYGWKAIPAVTVAYDLTPALHVQASAGSAFRIPTYTELYYSSAIQKGNALLQPEKADEYSTGFIYTEGMLSGSVSYFYRKGSDLIDWVHDASSTIWRAQNISKLNTQGVDASCTIRFKSTSAVAGIRHLAFGYTYLSTDVAQSIFQSKYVLDILRHKAIAAASFWLPADLLADWEFRYEDRYNQSGYLVSDLKLAWSSAKFSVTLDALNLFNKTYMDIANIPMPGRWLKAGMGLKF